MNFNDKWIERGETDLLKYGVALERFKPSLDKLLELYGQGNVRTVGKGSVIEIMVFPFDDGTPNGDFCFKGLFGWGDPIKSPLEKLGKFSLKLK